MKKDLTGQTFGRLTVVSFSHSGKKRQSYWLCRCVCDNSVTVRAGHLSSGSTQSCGCFQKEKLIENGARSGAILHQRCQESLALGVRRCSDCKKDLPLKSFGKNKRLPSGLANICKECFKPRVRATTLKKNFNLTEEEYNIILSKQGGVCFLCKRPPKKMRLSVDHRHGDGLLRSLLCWKCNNAIGSFRENIALLQAVITYLQLAPQEFSASLALGCPRYGIKGRVSNKQSTRKQLNRVRHEETNRNRSNGADVVSNTGPN